MDVNEARRIYQEDIYGYWRSGEQVSYEIHDKSLRQVEIDPANPFLAMFKLSTEDEGKDVEIMVEKEGRRVSFTVRAYLPESASAGAKVPFIVCMHPVGPKDYALSRGVAMIFMDTSMIAEDNCYRRGVFYDLYPYTEDKLGQTGELMAWGWGAAKVLDAVETGLGEALGLDPTGAMITGVSRWGKATAVCGAFEARFKYVVPVCSGAGGLALWSYQSEGKSYDLSACGGPADYIYGKNEPLDCLQSDAERGWFVDNFLKYKTYKDIPVDQYMLPLLAADPDRYYCIVAAWTGEDWVNAPAMWECYEEAGHRYQAMGLGDHIRAYFHKEGHALLEEDLSYIFKEFRLA